MHAFLRMLLGASSGLVSFECTVWHDGWFPPQFFSNRSSGKRRRKKSKAVPSSGTREVGPVRSTNSSTWTGELSIVQRSSISSSLSLSLLLLLSLSETEISDSSLNCLHKALALSTSSVSKPKNSSPSESDAIITQGYGNSLTHFRWSIVKNICMGTYLVFCVKRNIRISPIG